MKSPPFLVAAALLFWALETKLYLYGIAGALILESSRFIERRWDLSAKDFSRIVDFCSVVFLIGAVFNYGQYRQTLIEYIRWTPIIFLPFMIAEAYAARDLVSMSTFFWIMRKKGKPMNAMPGRGLSFAFPYVGICIVAASAANRRDLLFFCGAVLMISWSLWSIRKPKVPALIWVTSIAVAVALGFVAQAWVHYFQYVLETKSAEWFSDWRFNDLDKAMSRTTIGNIGKMKMSNAVVMKIRTPPTQMPPLYLCEATYQIYRQKGHDSAWYTSRTDYKPILPEDDGRTWNLSQQKTNPGHSLSFQVLEPFELGKGTLALPSTTSSLSDLQAILMEKNDFSSIRIDGAASFLSYKVFYGGRQSMEAGPTTDDLKVPSEVVPTLKTVIDQYQLSSGTAKERLNAVQRYFQNNFTYSLDIKHNIPSIFKNFDPLADFLLNLKKGHCQYFATSTVLLLRQLGIPARYATGFSVQEYSQYTNLYIIRSRHAHAWVHAFIDNHWIDFDTTPSTWAKEEEDQVSAWDKSLDLFSWFWFNFSEWRSLKLKESYRSYFIALSSCIGLGLAVYFVFIKRKDLKTIEKSTALASKRKRIVESDFYLLEAKLSELGNPRMPQETILQWIQRLKNHSNLKHLDEIDELSKLHYRHRFDPAGLKPEERSRLKSESDKLIKLLS